MATGERFPPLDDGTGISGAFQVLRAEVLWRIPSWPGTENLIFLN